MTRFSDRRKDKKMATIDEKQVELINAITWYAQAQADLQKQYIKAVNELNEMFNKRTEGVRNEYENNAPVQ